MNYYNEINPYCVMWLCNLIEAGHIAPGIVDNRDIRDVNARDLTGFTQVHLFAGIGIWSHALRSAGWPDDRPVWTGSCPCQPFSCSGKRGNFNDERHLWPEMFRLARECRPDVILGEQVASRDALMWFDAVAADLESEAYTVGAVDTCAAGHGAPHIRQRLYWMAYADNGGRGTQRPGQGVLAGDRPAFERLEGLRTACRTRETNGFWRAADWLRCKDAKWRPVEPGTSPLADGYPGRLERLRAYGNAIVAPQAQTFIEGVMECMS